MAGNSQVGAAVGGQGQIRFQRITFASKQNRRSFGSAGFVGGYLQSMPSNQVVQQTKLIIGITGVLGLPAVAHAAAPLYFDIAGLFWSVGFYIGGLVLLIVLLCSSKTERRNKIFGFSLLLYIFAPLFLIYDSFERYNLDSPGYKEFLGKNKERLSAHCINSQKKVLARAQPEGDLELSVRLENWSSNGPKLNGYEIATYFMRNPYQCNRSNIKYIEEVSLIHDESGKPFIRLHRICSGESNDRYSIETRLEPKARYEMVVSHSQKEIEHSKRYGSAVIYAPSIKIVDRLGGEVLGQDTLHYLHSRSGMEECQSNGEKMTNLIADVFGR